MQHNISYHQYADDLQLYMSLTPTPNRSRKLSTIELCASDVSRCFGEKALLLNPAKTEDAFFGTRQRLLQLDGSQGIGVAGTKILFNDMVKLLGVTLDSTLCFDKHVTHVASQRPYHIRALKHIRALLTLEALKTFAVSIVSQCHRPQPRSTLAANQTVCHLQTISIDIHRVQKKTAPLNMSK